MEHQIVNWEICGCENVKYGKNKAELNIATEFK
jgi:hypothetical protein